jgi:hypothetical protein
VKSTHCSVRADMESVATRYPFVGAYDDTHVHVPVYILFSHEEVIVEMQRACHLSI